MQTVYVRNFEMNLGPRDVYPLHAFQIRSGPTEDDGYRLIKAISWTGEAPPPVLPSQRWPPASVPYTFKIINGSSQIAGTLVLERHDGERLYILLGSTRDFGVGFNVASISDIDRVEEVQESFRPRAPGTLMVLRDHQVRLNADPQIHSGAKYYMIDITVEPIYHPRNPIDVVSDFIPEPQSQLDEHPSNALKRRIEKIKHTFRSPRI